ncbi:LuxR C-terminal-related transcriptional regulator [Reichenbachiella carrageenanivorans]|uniref:LuxR C-terminal-related transcriptional regulator n=1 Tax=Reichenbachiella carrageenanivorans TaxID=2979869 RepID=A0ABY6D3U4_9BACT|nr:LuxR C-terminal-related transcriptional regulator [Reichenbachiella carrageenanivorans]UXX80826.1 LuxR C-terminal-related transcriptional regulator [Reichenbachiella carrageenanivorans]
MLRSRWHCLSPGQGNANSLANRTKLVGSLFLELGQLDSAGFYLGEAAKEYERVGDQWRLASCWLDQAEWSIKMEQLGDAEEYAEQAHEFFLRNDHSEYFISSNNMRAKVYGEMHLVGKALNILVENEIKCKELGLIKSLRQNYLLQSELLDKAGEKDRASDMKNKYQLLNDSIQKLDNNEQLNRLALQVKFDKLEQENQILTQRYVAKSADLESTIFKLNGLTIGAVILLMILGIVIYLVRKKMKHKYVQLEKEVETLRQQIKLLLEGDTSGVIVDLQKLNGCLTTPLTDREFEILGHAISNLSNAQIAEQVFVSVNTVKYHLKNIYDKLGVSNRKQALEYVVQTK